MRDGITDSPVDRRSVLRNLGVATGAIPFLGAGVAADEQPDLLTEGRETDDPDHPVVDLAIEHESHPSRQTIAFTSLTRQEGFQLYLAHGTRSPTDVPSRIELITDAEYGVHGVSWQSPTTLRYSRDGATYERTTHDGSGIAVDRTRERLVEPEPLPLTPFDGQVTGRATVVKCTSVPYIGDWCVRVHAQDSGHTPTCNNNPTPPAMTHNHFAVYPQSDAKGGINLWAGTDGGCFYAGEEHYAQQCIRVCYDGSFPSLSAIADAYEEILLIATAAAGISLAPVVAKALAYILGGLTIKPPVGFPV